PPRHDRPREGDIRHSHADLSLVASALGYEPRVELSAGLSASREYYETLAPVPAPQARAAGR
ncbi:MAG TPA: LPS biosynthesis protein WbpP, partial [Thermoanaerobaculia bacterium]|nr:LPS biosynthesis protein WbpP [Thermoanaerobaculia bacterium]